MIIQNFVNFYGVVEGTLDPEKMGRVRVRVLGAHTDNKTDIPTEDLPWATVSQPTTSAAISGVGTSPRILKGTHVIGFFRDGVNGQDPIITGTIPGKPKSFAKPHKGFNDPTGKYPRYVNEPDINRLARNEELDKTILTNKEKVRQSGINVANSDTVWDEPTSPYNAQYPYNQVTESESGHVFEVDDTPDHERLHRYHRSGTYEETHADGTQVIKIVRDRYTLVADDDHVKINGQCFITVDGDAFLYVKKNLEVQVDNSVNWSVGGDYKVNVQGDYNVRVNGQTLHDSNGSYLVTSNGTTDVVGSNIHLNSYDRSATAPSITSAKAAKDIEIPMPLNEFLYSDDDVEMPDSKRTAGIEAGYFTQAELDIKPVSNESDNTPVTTTGTAVECPLVGDKIDYTLHLSDNYKLSNVTTNTAVSSYQVRDQAGLTKADIVCNLKNLAVNVLEPIRKKYPGMIITSGFRVGNGTSQHYKGEAVDMQFPSHSASDYYEIARWIKNNISYDQLLLEYKTYGTGLPWIHVSVKQSSNRQTFATFLNNSRYGSPNTLHKVV